MRALLLLLSLSGISSLAAQGTPGAPVVSAAGQQPDTAPLVVGALTVHVFRSKVGVVGPAERARMADERIRRAARPGPDSLGVLNDSIGSVILLNGVPVFAVMAADLPPDVDTTGGRYLADVLSRFRAGLNAYEEARSARAIAIGAVSVTAATLLLGFLLRLLARSRQWMVGRASRRMHDFTVSGVRLVSTDGLRRVLLFFLGGLSWVIGLLFLYAWATFSLTRFPYTRPWGMVFGKFLVTTVASISLAILHSIPGLITAVLILLAAQGLVALLRTFFDAVAEQRVAVLGIHPDTVPATRRITNAVIWLFAVAFAYPFLPGAGSESFKGVSVLAGVLVTFGSAGLVGQAMSGLLLMYSRGYKAGDFIRVGSTEGTVVELGLLSTRIRNVANEFILVPNSTMVSGSITDYSAAGREGRSLFVTASVTIGYDAPWQRIHELLLAAGARLPGAIQDPSPFVLQRSLGDFYVAYEVFVPIDSERAISLPELRSHLNSLIQDTFWAAGQEITSPHFFAARDGNEITIPSESHPRASGRAFRVAVDPK